MARSLRNWAKTHRSEPRGWLTPTSEADVVAAVLTARRQRRKIRVVGGAHSWSDIAMADDLAMTLDGMQGITDIDHARHRVTVLGGTRLFRLNRRLAANGLAMRILGSIDQQSIAGAIATGTHGSSLRHGNLSSLVVGMRLVTGRGEVLVLSEGDPRLAGARVALGALGVVTEVTLQCEPAFRLEENMRSIRTAEAILGCVELARETEYGKLWLLPHTGYAQWFGMSRTPAPGRVSEVGRFFDETVVNGLVFGGLLRVGGLRPSWIPRFNQAIARSYLAPRRRVGQSDRILNIAMPPLHREVEYALPVERTAEALEAMRVLIKREKLRVNFVIEARFAKGDDAWLSPAHGRDTCHLGAYMADTEDLDAYFYGFEELMKTMEARPHWGKEFRTTAAELAPLYPAWRRFAELRNELDPERTFANRFTERVLGR